MHESEEGALSTFLLIALGVSSVVVWNVASIVAADISFGVVGRCVSTSAAKTKTWIATPTDGHHIALFPEC